MSLQERGFPGIFHSAQTMCKGPSGRQFLLGEHSFSKPLSHFNHANVASDD
jgi:hypothetical protein